MTIDLHNLDKTGWQAFRFDQIAKSNSERVDPNNTQIELYYGLEHLDSESLHIRRSGTPADVSGQKLKCYPGDIIFGKRRAYQRKAAQVADVAICSAHAMVLRANPEVINPKIFPFFLHSDQFMHRAVDISVGSLSPTINWKTLREQEFLLPPKEQQAEIAELLWAMDDVVEKQNENFSAHLVLIESYRAETFKRGRWKMDKLGNQFEVQLGKMLSSKAKSGESPYPYLTNKNVQWGRIVFDELNVMDFTEKERSKFALRDGDLLVCEGGEVGRTAIWRGQKENCFYQKALHRLRVKEKNYLPEVMLEFMKIKQHPFCKFPQAFVSLKVSA